MAGWKRLESRIVLLHLLVRETILPTSINAYCKLPNLPEDFIDSKTPAGEKKKLSPEMAKEFLHDEVEKLWYAHWEKSVFFKVDVNSDEPSFTIVVEDDSEKWQLERYNGFNDWRALERK
ncbi:hypothetical protein Tco_1154302 [Tanacetum coccineum]